MTATNSARYRKQSLAKREIPDGLASPAPTLPPVRKAKRKAEKEAKKRENLCKIASTENPAKANDFTFRIKRERSETKAKESRETEASQETPDVKCSIS